MDYRIDTKTHRAAIDTAADALPRRDGILPALTLVQIEAREDGTVTYRGTDLDFSIEVTMPCEVSVPGSTCLPGRQLAEIARASDPAGKTRIYLADSAGAIEAGNSRFRLAAAPADDYVGGPASLPAGGSDATVPSDVLGAMAGRVAWLTAKEEARGILCGVLLETTATSLRMVATNGRQVGITDAPVAGLPADVRCTVPPQLLAAAERHFKGRGPVSVAFGDTTVSLKVEGLALTGRTLAGTYPDYAKILPRAPGAIVQVPTARLAQAVRRTATVARSQPNEAVVLRAENRTLRLWTNTPDVGSAHDQVEATILGDPVTLAFNAAMMADVLDAVSAEEVRIRLHGPRGGILLDGRGDDPIRSLWLVMPVSLESVDCTEPETSAEVAAEAAPLAAAA
jgi:DNA polymerase-3 subunit beta